jgi:Protein of unknown function (DUF2934)
VLAVKDRPVQPTQPKANPKPSTLERRVENAGAFKDEIQLLAYKKWQQAGCPMSDGIEFWLAAEKEILSDRCR